MVLSVENLRIEKSDFSLRVASLQIHGSSITAICGASGSGKTTFLNALAGLEDLKSGRIELNGKEIQKLSPQKRKIGYIFQGLALFPGLSVKDNLAYGLRAQRSHSNKDIQTEIVSLSKTLGISELLERKVETLSGGEKQRVAIGRALAPKPDLLLLDEPFSALDTPLKMKLRYYLRWVQSEWKIPMICVTHDQEDALALSDTLAFFYGGRLIEHQKTNLMIQNPQHLETARFFQRNQVLRLDQDSRSNHLTLAGVEVRGPEKRQEKGRDFENLMIPPEAVSLDAETPDHRKESEADEILLPINDLRVERLSLGYKIHGRLADGQEVWVFQKESDHRKLSNDRDYLIKLDKALLRFY